MLSSLLLSFREGLEAALVVGIILVQLSKMNRKNLTSTVYAGALVGFIVSCIVGFFGFQGAQRFDGEGTEIFEGIMMLLAASMIAYFILWLHRSNQQGADIRSQVSKKSDRYGLFIITFVSVFREGLELVIFNLTQITNGASSIALGSVIGIVLAIAVASIIFKSSIKFNLGIIFKVLGIILILIGGELFGEGLIKLWQAGGELVEKIGMIAFIVPALYIFLKPDIQKWRKVPNA